MLYFGKWRKTFHRLPIRKKQKQRVMNINQRSFSSHQQQLRPWNGFGFSHSLDMEMTDYHPTFNPNSEPGKPINSIIFKYYDVERLEQKLSVKM